MIADDTDRCLAKHPENNFQSGEECHAACPLTKNTFDFKKFCGKPNNNDLTEKTQQYEYEYEYEYQYD